MKYLNGYDAIQRYLSREKLLVIILKDSHWIKDMFGIQAKYSIEIFKFAVDKGMIFDGVFPANDMGYRNELLSPQLYKELILLSDKMLCD